LEGNVDFEQNISEMTYIPADLRHWVNM